jgi:hypothetical protein
LAPFGVCRDDVGKSHGKRFIFGAEPSRQRRRLPNVE